MTSSYNNVSNMSIDDYFVRSLYEGDIYKTANLQNKLLAQYCPNDTALKAEQQRIEKELVTFENKLWGIEEPDTTTTAPAEVKAEKKATARPAVSRTPKSESTKAEPAKREAKTEKKTERKSASVRTSRPKSMSSKSSNSSQTLSVRRERR
jgi:hypothetical protein